MAEQETRSGIARVVDFFAFVASLLCLFFYLHRCSDFLERVHNPSPSSALVAQSRAELRLVQVPITQRSCGGIPAHPHSQQSGLHAVCQPHFQLLKKLVLMVRKLQVQINTCGPRKPGLEIDLNSIFTRTAEITPFSQAFHAGT